MTATVLIVDDVAHNRLLIADALEDEGYTLLEATDGLEALHAAEERRPDLILMDVMMPRLTGIECLQRLKADDRTVNIPVILVTACDQDDDVVRGLEAGATDHIAKPFSREVTRARVKAALASKLAHDVLARRNTEIMQLTYAMTHDLQTPLVSLSGSVAVLRTLLGDLTEDSDRWLTQVEDSAVRLSTMLDDLLVYAKAGSVIAELIPIRVTDAVREVYSDVAPAASSQGTRLMVDDSVDDVTADPKLLYRVLANIVGNAVKFFETDNGLIETTVESSGNTVRIIVRDNGPGIPPSQLENVFLPFKRATATKKGTGLGLSLVRRHVEAMSGRVWLESDGATGTTVTIELPGSSTTPEAQRAA